jgi:hypothetical protein
MTARQRNNCLRQCSPCARSASAKEISCWVSRIACYMKIGIGIGIGIGVDGISSAQPTLDCGTPVPLSFPNETEKPKRNRSCALQRSLRDQPKEPSRFINLVFPDNANSPPEDRRPPRMLRMRNFPAEGRGGRSCPTGATSRLNQFKRGGKPANN